MSNLIILRSDSGPGAVVVDVDSVLTIIDTSTIKGPESIIKFIDSPEYEMRINLSSEDIWSQIWSQTRYA